jgi:hypothetical protein
VQRLHLEEDVGKLLHEGALETAADYGRGLSGDLLGCAGVSGACSAGSACRCVARSAVGYRCLTPMGL